MGDHIPNLGPVQTRSLNRPNQHAHPVITVGRVGFRLDPETFPKALLEGLQFRIVAGRVPGIAADDALGVVPRDLKKLVTDTPIT